MLADAEVQGPPIGAAGPLLRLPVLRQERGLAGRSWCCCSRPGRPSRPRARAAPGRAPRAPCRRPCGWRCPWLGSNVGSAVGPAVGQLARRLRSRARARPGWPRRQASNRCCHAACASGPRSPTLRACARTSSATSKVLLRVEAEQPLGGGDLVLAEGRAVGLAGVLLVRGRPGDDRAQRDDRRPLGLGLGRVDRVVQRARRRPRRRSTAGRASRTPRSA